MLMAACNCTSFDEPALDTEAGTVVAPETALMPVVNGPRREE